MVEFYESQIISEDFFSENFKEGRLGQKVFKYIDNFGYVIVYKDIESYTSWMHWQFFNVTIFEINQLIKIEGIVCKITKYTTEDMFRPTLVAVPI